MEAPRIQIVIHVLCLLLTSTAAALDFPFNPLLPTLPNFFPTQNGGQTGGQSGDQVEGQVGTGKGAAPATGGNGSGTAAAAASAAGGNGNGTAAGAAPVAGGNGSGTAGGGAPAGGGIGGRRVGKAGKDFETGYKGKWELFSNSSGVSAMHMAIVHTNKAIMFDATNFGPSQLKSPVQPCRIDGRTKQPDCYAHALEFDIDTGNIRPLQVLTNPWCASGALGPDGTLVQTGGWWEGGSMIRYFQPCDTCDWKEYQDLARKRWYATQQILPDGGFIVIGGRREFNYEYVPPPGKPNTIKNVYPLPLLSETTEPRLENNLYPFVHLSTDGNLFIFANNRSILLDPRTNKVVREFPQLKGGARNYPGSGMSVLLPLNLNRKNGKAIPAEVIVCGGTPQDAMARAEQGQFNPVLNTCGRLLITLPNTEWKMEIMPKPRIMADMLLLPTADVLLLNGASKGSAGWELSRDPVFEPWLYQPLKPRDQRFKVLAPTTIARLYHSSSGVTPNGQILVAGSNPNDGYYFTGKMYPTELRVEKFSPPYLDPELASHRPEIIMDSLTKELKYDQSFPISFKLGETIIDANDVKVTMYAQPFTTHGYSMNQRLLILKTQVSINVAAGTQQLTATAPQSAVLAPPGYYLLFVVYRGVPSTGAWVHIQ